MKVSLVIPTYPPHFKYIFKLLENISNFTVLPYEVIISASSVDNNLRGVLSEIHNLSRINHANLNVKILATDEKQNASQNRNRGCKVAEGDFIMLVDGDDLVHIKKLEICMNVMQKNGNINLLVTNYDTFSNHWNTNCNLVDPYKRIYECFINPTCTNLYSEPKSAIHHGHVFFKSDIFRVVRYNEKIWPGEDGDFCQRVLKSFGGCYTVDEKLMGYMKGSDSTKTLVLS